MNLQLKEITNSALNTVISPPSPYDIKPPPSTDITDINELLMLSIDNQIDFK